MVLHKKGIVLIVWLFLILIGQEYAADLEISSKNMESGTVHDNQYGIMHGLGWYWAKPGINIADLHGRVNLSSDSNYDLIYNFSYVVENNGVFEVGPVRTMVYTRDDFDDEKIFFMVDGHPIESPFLIFNLSPNGSYTITGYNLIQKPHGWSSIGYEELGVKVENDSTEFDEKGIFC